MIDMTGQMMNRVTNLNKQNERISYQMSTGKVLNHGSDDSILYAQTLDIEDNVRVYTGLKEQIEKTTAQNTVANSSLDEIKLSIDSIKVDLMKSMNAGMDVSSRTALATNLYGLRENLLTIVNTTIDGQHIFAGSDTTKQTFVKDKDFDSNGKIYYNGDAILRQVAVEPATYRDRGVTGFDVLMYNTDTAVAGATGDKGTLSFGEQERIIDEDGLEWKLTDTLTVGGTVEAGDEFHITIAGKTITVPAPDTTTTNTAKAITDAINADDTMSELVTATINGSDVVISSKIGGDSFDTVISTTEAGGGAADNQTFTIASHDKIQKFDKNGDLVIPEVEIVVTNDAKTPPTYTTGAVQTTIGGVEDKDTRFLEAKHNYFDDLNIMINALKGYATKDNGKKDYPIDKQDIDKTLNFSLDHTTRQYEATNIGHAELGGRNNIFNISLERIDSKLVHYNILMQKTSGADMSKLAMESKSLEMTYQALYSTVSKMHSLSLLNYIK